MKNFYSKTNEEGLASDDLFSDIKEYIKTLKDRYIKIEVSIKRKLRSNSQNNLYWATLDLIAKEANNQGGEIKYTADDFHFAFREMFLTTRRGLIKKIQSTTGLNTKEFGEYLEKIKVWVWEHLSSKFIFPNPSDLYL
jgi:hypothetical protein